MITNFSIPTVAFGKFLNKLKSASVKLTLASTLSLIASTILALIWSLNKNGMANNAATNTTRTMALIFKTFFSIY
ncbi:hypothetical protein D3C72_2539630 [compost metagenome]